jgi:uncharacterized coiled-coil protein SlyX
MQITLSQVVQWIIPIAVAWGILQQKMKHVDERLKAYSEDLRTCVREDTHKDRWLSNERDHHEYEGRLGVLENTATDHEKSITRIETILASVEKKVDNILNILDKKGR